MADNLKHKRVVIGPRNFYRVFDNSKKHQVQLPRGFIAAEQLQQIPSGASFEVNGEYYYVLDCDLYDYLMYDLKRQTQIVYPKEAAYILLRLNIAPGSRVGEAGTGSGALTCVFSRAVGEQGRVYTYERRERFTRTIQQNVQVCQQYQNVVFRNQDIEEGIAETELDAFFLDLKNPWEVIGIVRAALKAGGHLGVLLPTTNQISLTLKALKQHSFYVTEILEILVRNYKLNPERLRPEDRMIGHTGYLVFARKLEQRLSQEEKS